MENNLLFLIENNLNDNVMGLVPHFESKSAKYLDFQDNTGSVNLQYIASNQPTVIPDTGEFVVEPEKVNLAYNNTKIHTDPNIEGSWSVGGNVAVLDDEDRLPYLSYESATTLTWTEGTGNPQKVQRTFNCRENTTYAYWIIVKPIKNSIFQGSDILDVSGDINNTSIIRFQDLNRKDNQWVILEGSFETSTGDNDYAEVTLSFYCTSLASITFGGLQIEPSTRTTFIPSIEDSYTLAQYNSPIIEKLREETKLEYAYWFPNLDELSSYTISATLSDYKQDGRLFTIKDIEENFVIDVSIGNNYINVIAENQALNSNPIDSYPVTIDIIVNFPSNTIVVCINGIITSQVSNSLPTTLKRRLIFSNVGLRKWKSFRIYDRSLEISNNQTGIRAGGEIEANLKNYPFSLINVISRKKSFLMKGIIPPDQGSLYIKENPSIHIDSFINQIYANRLLDTNLAFSLSEKNPVSNIYIPNESDKAMFKFNLVADVEVEDISGFHLGRAFLMDFNSFVQEVTILEVNSYLTLYPIYDSYKDLRIVQVEEENKDIPLIENITEVNKGYYDDNNSYDDESAHYNFQNGSIFYIKVENNIASFRRGKAYLRASGGINRFFAKGIKPIYIIDYLSLTSDEYLIVDLYDASYTESIFQDGQNQLDGELIQFEFEITESKQNYLQNGQFYRNFALGNKQNLNDSINLYQNPNSRTFYTSGNSSDSFDLDFTREGIVKPGDDVNFHENDFEMGILYIDDDYGRVNGKDHTDSNYLTHLMDSSRKEFLFSNDSSRGNQLTLQGDTHFLFYLIFGGDFDDWLNSPESDKPDVYFSSRGDYINSTYFFHVSSSKVDQTGFHINFQGITNNENIFYDQKIRNYYYQKIKMRVRNIDVNSVSYQSVLKPNEEYYREYDFTDIVKYNGGVLDSSWDNNLEWFNQFKSLRSAYTYETVVLDYEDATLQDCYVKISDYRLKASLLMSRYDSNLNSYILVLGFPSPLKDLANLKDKPTEIILPNLHKVNHFLKESDILPFNYKIEEDQSFISLPNQNSINLNQRYSKLTFPASIRESQLINNIHPRDNNEDYNKGLPIEADIYVDNPSSYRIGKCLIINKSKNLLLGEIDIISIYTFPAKLRCQRVMSRFENEQLVQPITKTQMVLSPYQYYANILNKDEDLSIVEKSPIFISISNKGDEDKTIFVSIDIL